MKLFEKPENCCGCGACKNICPKNAITMKADREGFLFPDINSELCVECGLCSKVCAFAKPLDISRNPYVVGLKHKNEDVRKNSRSGGAFTAVSDWVLERKGVVYGAAFNDDYSVSHKRAETAEGRNEFRKSKYVQSFTADVFTQVRDDLKDGRWVMFSGTPCQCEGMLSYLNQTKTDCEKLLLCDLVCHGVPSPKIWRDYLEFCSKNKQGRVENVEFRDKSFGWNQHIESYFVNGSKYSDKIYTTLFYRHECIRKSCFKCKYTSTSRVGDFTLADFWGIDNDKPEFNDNKGVSLFFVSTDKGRKIFDEVEHQLDYFKADVENAVRFNPMLEKPFPEPSGRQKFWAEYLDKGFEYVAKKYGVVTFKTRVVRKLKRIAKKITGK